MNSHVVRLMRTSLVRNSGGGYMSRRLPCSSSYSFISDSSRHRNNSHLSISSNLGQRNYFPRQNQQNFLLSQSRLFSNSTVLNSQDPESKPKEGIVKRFKVMAKDYWYVLIPVHVATSIVWFGGFYLLAKSGVDFISLLEAIHIPRSYIEKLEGSNAGYYALAYACYKIATPARYTVTVGGTAYSIGKLKERGFIKTSSQLSGKMKDKKDEMKEKAQGKYDDMKIKKDKYKEELDSAWEKFSKTKRK